MAPFMAGDSLLLWRATPCLRPRARTPTTLTPLSMDSGGPLSALGRPRRSTSKCISPPPETSPMAEATCLNRADDPCSVSAAARVQGPTTALDLLRVNGYVIFDRLLSDKAMHRLCAERNSWFAATPRFQRDFYRSSHELVLHPLMLSIMDATLGPHCDWYQLNLTQVVQLHAGQRQQATHREEAVCPCQQSGIQHLVTAIWALSDFTEKTGAKLLWPRSHFTP